MFTEYGPVLRFALPSTQGAGRSAYIAVRARVRASGAPTMSRPGATLTDDTPPPSEGPFAHHGRDQTNQHDEKESNQNHLHAEGQGIEP